MLLNAFKYFHRDLHDFPDFLNNFYQFKLIETLFFFVVAYFSSIKIALAF